MKAVASYEATAPTHRGGSSLNITVNIVAQGGTNCQRGFPSTPNGDGSETLR